MAVKKLYNLVVATPGRDGKKIWQQLGVLMEMDDGRMSMKLNAMPVGPVADRDGKPVPWDGWISVFPKDDAQGGRTNSSPSSSAPDDLDKDKIPF